MIQAQEWLDKNYPKNQNQRKEIKELDLSNQNLEGGLDLSDFANLEQIKISGNPHLEKIKNIELEKIRKEATQHLADFVMLNERLISDLQNRNEKIVELEMKLKYFQENEAKKSSNDKVQQKKIAFLESNLTQMNLVRKQLVEEISSLKKNLELADRKVRTRNERIQSLEELLQKAQEHVTSQNEKFELQLEEVRETLERTRNQSQFRFTDLKSGENLKKSQQEIAKLKNDLTNKQSQIDELKQQAGQLKLEKSNLETKLENLTEDLEKVSSELLEIKKKELEKLTNELKTKLDESLWDYLEILLDNPENSSASQKAKRNLTNKINNNDLQKLLLLKNQIDYLEQRINEVSQQAQIEVLPPAYS